MIWRQAIRTNLIAPALTAALLLSACTGGDEPELTVEERLAAIEGRELTPSEVSERLVVAESLCRLDDPVLDRLWRQLDDDQLEFQDFVFDYQCPERSILYASHTGRYVTAEAEESGVVPSTTRPPSTTTTRSPLPTTSDAPGTISTSTTTETPSTEPDPSTSSDEPSAPQPEPEPDNTVGTAPPSDLDEPTTRTTR